MLLENNKLLYSQISYTYYDMETDWIYPHLGAFPGWELADWELISSWERFRLETFPIEN
jgi:hypothetical protein